MKRYIVTKYGLSDDGVTNNSKALQKLIDSINEGELFFAKGNYVLGTIFLHSNIHILLDSKACILGALSFYDYAPQEKIDYPLYQDQSHSYFHCSMFVGIDCENISISGGTIDMRSIWDEDNVRDIVHRGPKCIALKNCKNVIIENCNIYHATDLAIYFAGSEYVTCKNLNLKVYIDGISPDCSKHVVIKNCNVESGDDGIVFKSSYTLNRREICDDIVVKNCSIKSRCNAIKFGTETNGGFTNIKISNIEIFNSRITGISVESVDGANIKDIAFKNISMKNVGTPLFVHLGTRMRGPKDLKVGSIENISFENIKATGPYQVYECLPWNYVSFKENDCLQFPGITSKQVAREPGTWQVTSNICGLENNHLKNISLKHIYFEVDGGVKSFVREVPLKGLEYPEVHAYGLTLPAHGIYFRFVDDLKMDDVQIKTLHDDLRECFIFD